MALWTPEQLNSQLWLDAADSSTITLSGSDVIEWADKSGNNRDATPATAILPTMGTDAIVFSSGADSLITPSFDNPDASDGFTLFLVYKRTGEPASYSNPLTKGAINTEWSLLISNTALNNISYWRTALGDTAISPTETVTNNRVLFKGIINDDELSQWHDGSELSGSVGTATRNLGGPSILTIGSAPEGSYTQDLFQGEIDEIVLFHETLSSTDQELMEGYLAWKRGLEANLPSGHPYSSSPPTIPDSSEGSSGGGIPPLPVLRKIIDFNYDLMFPLRIVIEMPYSIKIAKLINFLYGDMPQYKKIVNMPYGDYRKLIKIIDMKYGDCAELRKIVDLVYDIRGQLRKVVDMPYHILEAELRKLLDFKYDLSLYDELRKVVDMPYAITTDESIEENTVVSVTSSNGYQFDPHHINIEDDEELAAIDFEMRSMVDFDYEEAVPLPLARTYLNVILNSDTYYFIIEERNEREGKHGDSYTIKAASPIILLDLPYASTFSEELSGLASDIVEYLVAKESSTISIIWEMIDWFIDPGKLVVSDLTPMAVIEQIVLAGGGIRQASPGGDLICRPLYPISIPDYDTATPGVYYTDMDNFYYVDSSTINKEGFNNFFIGDEATAVDSLKIRTESISSTQAKVRVSQVPFDDDEVLLSNSGGYWVDVIKNGIEEETIEEELVEIVDGQGNTEFPIYALYPDTGEFDEDSPDYRETDLGAITFNEDGTITCATAENTLVMLSYKTKHYSYTANDANIETVQFYPEIL